MVDISRFAGRLKELRAEIETAGFSIAGATGQLAKSAERRELEAMPSLAVLQGQLKRALEEQKKKNTSTAVNSAFLINGKIARRRELEKQFDKAKFIAKANALLAKLAVIENDYNTEMGVFKMADMEKKTLADEVRKSEQERRQLANQSQELQSRQREVRTSGDYQRLVEDANRLSPQIHTFSTEQENIKSKIRQFTTRYERIAAIPPQTVAWIKRELDLLKRSLEQAKMGR